MTAAYSPAVEQPFVSVFGEAPGLLANCGRAHSLPSSQFDRKSAGAAQTYDYAFPMPHEPLSHIERPEAVPSPADPEKAALDAGMRLRAEGGGNEAATAPYQQPNTGMDAGTIVVDAEIDAHLPSPYDSVPPFARDGQQWNRSTQNQFEQATEAPDAFTNTRPAIDSFSDASRTPVPQPQGFDFPSAPDMIPEARRPSSSVPTSMSSRRPSAGGFPNTSQHIPEQSFPSVLATNSMPSYKPSAIPISASTRVIAQQPTYITPPSSPAPIAANTVYGYAGGPYGAEVVRQGAAYVEEPYLPTKVVPTALEGKEICVECAMRDQDMADVDVTSPGVWDRESDIYYHELCRQEAEEVEERRRACASNSSSESHAVRKPIDPKRPRAKGHRLTEPNVKLWLTMNPREPQARQQTIDLYIKTQTALLEAEALARARALQESRILENKLRDTYDSLRRSTYEMGPSGDDSIVRVKGSHASKRSVSGPTPISLVVDGVGHHRNQSQSREVTILENGLIVETVDVKKEERERRREERRERSRARKSSRGSGGAEVMSMYSVASPMPHQADFYGTSNGSGMIRGPGGVERPMSLSQASTRAMSTPLPITPPPLYSPGAVRPPNVRVQSQISLLDTQSISSASMGARRSRFFAFRNWSEAWKSRESFAPSAVMSVSGSMMDMHVALDREKQQQSRLTRPETIDFGGSIGEVRHSTVFPRRASVSLERPATAVETIRPKKKKGFARIWGFVRGNKPSKVEVTQRAHDAQGTSNPRSEDDAPLAPPPPLSYLVNRSTPRERTLSTGTQRTSIGPPPLSGSSTLPTPTSIRTPWDGHEFGSRPASRMLTAHPEETSSLGMPHDAPDHATVPLPSSTTKMVQPTLSEPDMRQVQNGDSISLNVPPLPVGARPPRPISVYSLHKSLPPLPPDAPNATEQARPKTMYDLESPAGAEGAVVYGNGNGSLLVGSQAPFRRDMRRSSFGGMATRPTLPTSGTFPLRNGGPPQEYAAYSPYAELGVGTPVGQEAGAGTLPSPTSRSLGRFGSADEKSIGSDRTISKRRSKFGLAGLIEKISGKNNHQHSRDVSAPAGYANGVANGGESAAMVMHQSDSDLHSGASPSVTDFGTLNGNDSSRSKHGAQPASPLPSAQVSRMSIASRRAIEELVDQDQNFVAYRYPSVDQNIALLR